MTYAPPSGWMERIDKPTDPLTAARFRFHRRNDCERIRNPQVLVQVDLDPGGHRERFRIPGTARV